MPNNDRLNLRYEVGYRKPPQRTKFQKGSSGNPRGRPKQKNGQDIGALWDKILAQKITISEGGRSQKVTKLEALLLQITNGALVKDLKAVTAGIAVLRAMGKIDFDSGDSKERPLTDDDIAVIQDYLARVGNDAGNLKEEMAEPEKLKKE